MRALCMLLAALALAGCTTNRPQKGGGQTTTLGGADAPTTVTTNAPENPQTPTTTVVEKTTTREFAPAAPRPETNAAGLQNPTGHNTGTETATTAPTAAGASLPLKPGTAAERGATLVKETVTERAFTQTGAAQKDTSRDLAAKLANMRGVLWVGVLLLIGGPLLGWKMGWFTNGCIAGAVGLLLIILSTVIPGNEAWFGLGGLLFIPLVAYVYYRSRHDEREEAKPQPPTPLERHAATPSPLDKHTT